MCDLEQGLRWWCVVIYAVILQWLELCCFSCLYFCQEGFHCLHIRLVPIIVNHVACAIDAYYLALVPKIGCYLANPRCVDRPCFRIAGDQQNRTGLLVRVLATVWQEGQQDEVDLGAVEEHESGAKQAGKTLQRQT